MSAFNKFARKAEATIETAVYPIVQQLEKELIAYFQRLLNRLPNISALGTVNGELTVLDKNSKIVYYDKYTKLIEEADTALTEFHSATGYAPQPLRVYRDRVEYKYKQD